MNASRASISEALERTRLAQKRLNLMLHAFNQLEENDGIGSKSANDFHDSSVGEAHDALNKAKKQLSETQATTAEEILRKVALLVDADHDELLAPVKAEIEALMDPLETPVGTLAEGQPKAHINPVALECMTAYELFQFQDALRRLCDRCVSSGTLSDVAYDLHYAAWQELIARDVTKTDDALAAVLALFNDGEFENVIHGKQLQDGCKALIARLAKEESDARLAEQMGRVVKAA